MQHDRHIQATACLATLLAALISPAASNAQPATDGQPQVRLESWVVLGTDDFKRRLEAAGNNNQPTSDAETRVLLSQGVLSGEAEIVLQPTLLTPDGTTAEFACDVQLPLAKLDANGTSVARPDGVRVDFKITPQVLTSRDTVLALSFTTSISQVAARDTEDSITRKHTVTSKILVSNNGPAVLGGLLDSSREQFTPQGQRRELLFVVTPKVQ